MKDSLLIHNHCSRCNDNWTEPAMDGQVTVVVVPLLAQGHLNQLLHFSRLLAACGLPVHFVSAAAHVRQARDRAQSVASITFHSLPFPIPFDNPPPDPNSLDKYPAQLFPLFKAMVSLREPVYELVREVSAQSRRVVVVYDSVMAHVVQDVAGLPNVEAYCFHCTNAFTYYSFLLHFAGKPDEPADGDAVKLVPPWESCFPAEFSELAKLVVATPEFHSGNIYNTSRVIDGLYLDVIAQGRMDGVDKHWAIGPFHLLLPTISNNRCLALEWLHKQKPNSVIYVSFGSTVSLSDAQIAEIGVGLEKSGHKFIWVVRDADRGDIFDGEIRKPPLPQGYEERVEGRGIVIRDWAPQVEILGHGSIGGFMSHCGWNSCIESISSGVPMATWPMHSDQPGNAVLITDVLKMGLQVREWEQRQEVVSSSRIEEVVKRLMASKEGDELRKRASDVGYAVKQSVADDGVTRLELNSFIQEITR